MKTTSIPSPSFLCAFYSEAVVYVRRARLVGVNTGPPITTRALHQAGNVLRESYAGGPTGAIAVTSGCDSLLRRTNVSILASQANLPAATADVYDAAPRLPAVSDATNQAAHTHPANSPLVEEIKKKRRRKGVAQPCRIIG